MLEAIFRPIESWPGKRRASYDRRNSPFDSTYPQTLDLLERELNHLNAQNIIVQAEVDLGQVRNDGWLKSNAAVRGPAVILSFSRQKEEFSYPCDTFNHWQANIRAIALSLEALRKVDRYGVTSNGQQYQGFKRLVAPDSIDVRAAAVAILAALSGRAISASPSTDEVDAAYRAAAKRCHPDVSAGKNDWARLQGAVAMLRGKPRER